MEKQLRKWPFGWTEEREMRENNLRRVVNEKLILAGGEVWKSLEDERVAEDGKSFLKEIWSRMKMENDWTI